MLFSFLGAPWRALLVVLALGGGGSLLAPDALARERAASNGGSGAKPEAYASQERRVAHSRTRDGEAEARLLNVYRLIGQNQTREALAQAEALLREHPNFQLAQLVYGDLLNARRGAARDLRNLPPAAAATLGELQEESALRLRALRERPAPGLVPANFLQVAPRSRHAIAVDASRSRLYLFENTAQGLKLIADYYVSVGKLGVEKSLEGDQRTPLGVYYITSSLDGRKLKDFYGAGALPINYPNPLDLRRGKTGSGIWLHGTPPDQFSRAPKASDGCVVVANPDLERILRTVQVRTTPVVIATSLQWVKPEALAAEREGFGAAFAAWQQTKLGGDLAKLMAFYTDDFSSYGKNLTEWSATLEKSLSRNQGRAMQIKDLSLIRWRDVHDTMVTTFGEVPAGASTGTVRRQYWQKNGAANDRWKIFFEGVIG